MKPINDRQKQASLSVGKLAMAKIETRGKSEGITIPVKVAGYRTAYGRLEYLVEPIGGQGTVWINADRLAFSDQIRQEGASWIQQIN